MILFRSSGGLRPISSSIRVGGTGIARRSGALICVEPSAEPISVLPTLLLIQAARPRARAFLVAALVSGSVLSGWVLPSAFA